MKKKILASLLAIVAVFACLSFTACADGDNNYSETYEGTLSTEAYTTVDDAARAFIINEIDSDSSPSAFQSYAKVKDLSDNEIASLNLTEAEIADIKSAEKGKITYIKDAAYEKSQTVYIIEFNTPTSGGSVKYFAPLPQNGEAVTKSYLESVYNPEHYKNCTATYEMPITVKVSQGGISFTEEISVKYTFRITQTAVEMVMTIKAPYTTDYGIYYETMTVTSYLIDSPDGILQATLYEDEWDVTNFTDETDVGKISDLFSYNLPDADYSYFTKTSTGFKMDEEFLNALMEELIAEADIEEYFDSGFSHSISANYYVTEGRLDSAQVVLKMSGTIDGVKTNITIKAVNKYSAFGTTTVTVPEEAKSALGI